MKSLKNYRKSIENKRSRFFLMGLIVALSASLLAFEFEVVFVTFVVEKDGSVVDAKVLRGIGGGCDEEALRVVRNMPKWNPGEQRGKKVKVQYNLPVRFTLR